MVSHEYLGAAVIVIISIAKAFGYELGNDEVTTIVTGAVALYVAFRRFQKGDIKVSGVKF